MGQKKRGRGEGLEEVGEEGGYRKKREVGGGEGSGD